MYWYSYVVLALIFCVVVYYVFTQLRKNSREHDNQQDDKQNNSK